MIFPSFNDLQFLASMNALSQDQVNMYVNGGAITVDQAKQLGFNVGQQSAPKSNASASSTNAKPSQVIQSSSNQNK